MPSGVPIDRQWVYVLEDGKLIIDWGVEQFQDMLNGDFFTSERSAGSHPVRDDELDMLLRAGLVERLNARHVYICSSPERPGATLE
ncbi:MAG: hypothetical protein V3U36_04135 [Anaerolineales bacterium]|jgi:hypothetical protein